MILFVAYFELGLYFTRLSISGENPQSDFQILLRVTSGRQQRALRPYPAIFQQHTFAMSVACNFNCKSHFRLSPRCTIIGSPQRAACSRHNFTLQTHKDKPPLPSSHSGNEFYPERRGGWVRILLYLRSPLIISSLSAKRSAIVSKGAYVFRILLRYVPIDLQF